MIRIRLGSLLLLAVLCSTRVGFRTKSTVGIMLNDCTVENIVVGGPAFISRAVANGDTILKIDNTAVTPGKAPLRRGTLSKSQAWW